MPAPVARPPIFDIGFYFFVLRSKKDYEEVSNLIKIHNDRLDTGAELRTSYVTRFRGEILLGFLGEARVKSTTAFLDAYLARHCPEIVCIWPCQAPDDWLETRRESFEGDAMLAVLAKLPEAPPDTPSPFSPQPPPHRTLGDGLEEIFAGGGMRFKPDPKPVQAPAKYGCYGCGILISARCKACGYAFYCSKACQTKDWYLHKRLCPLVATGAVAHWK